MKFLRTGVIVESHFINNAENGAEFACVHNRDGDDFMNQEKFERSILKMQQNHIGEIYLMRVELRLLSILLKMRIRRHQKSEGVYGTVILYHWM